MTVTAPTLFWYQLETGTYVPDYFLQLDTCVRALCGANSVTAPTASVVRPTPGGYLSAWLSQIDTAVRALCVALSVTPPVALLAGQTMGQFAPTYMAALDTCVRALCAAVPPPSYTGPLDLTATPAVVAYGQRRLAAAFSGSLIEINNGTTTQDFAGNTNNAVDVAAIAAFIGAGSSKVAKLFDQSGNASNGVQATSANQPSWIASATNARPGIGFDKTNSQFLVSTSGVSARIMTVFAVIAFGTETTESLPIIGYNWADDANPDGPDFVFSYTPSGTPSLIASSDSLNFSTFFTFESDNPPITASTYCIVEGVWDTASGALLVNGANLDITGHGPGDVGSDALPLVIGGSDAVEAALGTAAYLLSGTLEELLVFGAAVSSSDRTAIRQNIATYYGITLS